MKNLLKRMPAAALASIYLNEVVLNRGYNTSEKTERLLLKLDSYANINDAIEYQFDGIIRSIIMEIAMSPFVRVETNDGKHYKIYAAPSWIETHFAKYVKMDKEMNVLGSSYSIKELASDPELTYKSREAVAAFVNNTENRTEDNEYEWKRIVVAKTDEEIEQAEEERRQLQQEKREDKLS